MLSDGRLLGYGWDKIIYCYISRWGTDNAVVDAIKLILLIYNNFSIIKKVVNKIERVK